MSLLLVLNFDSVLVQLNEYLNIIIIKQICKAINGNSKIKSLINSKKYLWYLRYKHKKILLEQLMYNIHLYWRCIYDNIFEKILHHIRLFRNKKTINQVKTLKEKLNLSEFKLKIIHTNLIMKYVLKNYLSVFDIQYRENNYIYNKKYFNAKQEIYYNNNEYLILDLY